MVDRKTVLDIKELLSHLGVPYERYLKWVDTESQRTYAFPILTQDMHPATEKKTINVAVSHC